MNVSDTLATRLEDLRRMSGPAPALALRAIEAAKGADAAERLAAAEDALVMSDASSGADLAGLGTRILQRIPLVGGSEAAKSILESLREHPETARAAGLACDALRNYPTNLCSYRYAAQHVLAGATATCGTPLVAVATGVFKEIDRGYDDTCVSVGRVFVDALQNDAEVGTAMWYSTQVLDELKGYPAATYVMGAALQHASAKTGQELATLALQALDRMPEACPKPGARLAIALIRPLRGLYDDGPSRAVVDKAMAEIESVMPISMAFGGGAAEFPAARAIGREALVALQSTEDAATRLYRRVAEGPAPGAGQVSVDAETVTVGGVKVPRNR